MSRTVAAGAPAAFGARWESEAHALSICMARNSDSDVCKQWCWSTGGSLLHPCKLHCTGAMAMHAARRPHAQRPGVWCRSTARPLRFQAQAHVPSVVAGPMPARWASRGHSSSGAAGRGASAPAPHCARTLPRLRAYVRSAAVPQGKDAVRDYDGKYAHGSRSLVPEVRRLGGRGAAATPAPRWRVMGRAMW